MSQTEKPSHVVSLKQLVAAEVDGQMTAWTLAPAAVAQVAEATKQVQVAAAEIHLPEAAEVARTSPREGWREEWSRR